MSAKETIKRIVDSFNNKPLLRDKTREMGEGLMLGASLADDANKLSKDVQAQVDQLVVEGDSSVEAAQARVDASGKSYTTLKKRLDEKEQETTAQFQQTDQKKQNKIKREVSLDDYLHLVSNRNAVADEEFYDWTEAFANAVNDLDGGGTLKLSGRTYRAKVFAIKKGINLEGLGRDTSYLIKNDDSQYTGTNGITKKSVVFVDGKINEPVYFWNLTGVTLKSDYPDVEALSMNNSAKFGVSDVRVHRTKVGLTGTALWLGVFERVIGSMINEYFVDFSSDNFRTSLIFFNCWSEACGGGWNLRNTTYSSFISCACDYCNFGENPSDPYYPNEGKAGGNYKNVSWVFKLSACKGVSIIGMGFENSNAGLVQAEGSFVEFSGCYGYQWDNYAEGTASEYPAFISIRGKAKSKIKLTNSFFENLNNKASKKFQNKAIFIENQDNQSVIIDNYIQFNEDQFEANAYLPSDGLFFTGQKFLKNNVNESFQQDFILKNNGSYANGTILIERDNLTFKKKIVLSAKNITDISDTTKVDHHWILPIDNIGKKEHLKIDITIGTAGGSIGALALNLKTFDTTESHTVIKAININSSNPKRYQTIIDLKNAKKNIYLELPITYKGQSYSIEEIELTAF